ncbi:MAG: chorismate synthase [Acidobacteria bacterium]|nr:chorismate synthase [Acidobacteriota bacterium]
MSGSTFGHIFRVTTAGESHGPANVAIVDGCPAGLPLSVSDIQPELDRRRPGQSSITTQRREGDQVQILSGVFEGKTTGTPIGLLIPSLDQRSGDYSDIEHLFRPGHADFTFHAKYGIRDPKGGGRASARETVARVAAGAIARKLLQASKITVIAYTCQVGNIVAQEVDGSVLSWADVDQSPVRCPDLDAAGRMEDLIHKVRKEGDSIGGACRIEAFGVPAGLGEPVFDKLKADLAKALLSIPAVMSFEYGIGAAAAELRGSQCNDPFAMRDQHVVTVSNRHGGMLGGITSGMPITMRVVVKPTSSLPQAQQTVSASGEPATIRTKGRHDPCLLPRFAPIAESMVCLVLADHLLRQRSARA